MFHSIKRTHRLPWRRLTIGAIIALIAVSLLVWQWPQVMGVGHHEPSPTPTQGERRPAPIALSLRERDYLSQLGPITVCPDPNWPPYEQVDAEGHFTGITADLLDLIAARLGIEFTYVIARDWSETVALSQAGEVLILPFLNQTPSREEWLVFTEPLLTDVAVFVTREEHPFITDAAELTDRTIVLPPGTSVEERVRRDFPNLTIMRVASEIDAFTAVSNREADMTLRSLTVAAYTIRREGLFNLKIAGQAPDPYLNRLRMGVLKDEPLLRDILNKGIATITPREREEIINRHVNITVVQPVDYGLIFRVAAVLVGLIGAAFYMNIRLSKVNAALRESERSKAVLLANLPGMAYRCHYDRQWTMEFVSEGCLALTGYHSEDLLDNRLVAYNDVIVPEDRERVWESWQQAAEAQHPALLEYRIVTAGGEEKWVYERGIIVDNGHDGTPRIEGLIIDITERKRAEEALIRYQEHLEDLVLGRTAEIQAQYAESVAILRSVGDAICMTDPDRRIVYVNPAFTRLTGYTADEALGREMQKMEVFENLEVRVPAMMATLREGESWEGDERAAQGRTSLRRGPHPRTRPRRCRTDLRHRLHPPRHQPDQRS